MKLIRGNKCTLAAAVFLMTACSYRPEAALPEGLWQFTEIRNGDSMLVEIPDEQALALNSDSSFTGFIVNTGLALQGRWTYSEHTLHLNTTDPDTGLHFETILISEKNMILKEGDTRYELSRND